MRNKESWINQTKQELVFIASDNEEKIGMRILVTGATGFVGSEIVRELSKRKDFELYLTGSPNSPKKNGPIQDCKSFYQIDIRDKISVNRLLEAGNIDSVIHSAGLAHQFGRVKKEDFWRTNVSGTENICELAAQLAAKHFILISSVSVYGNYGNEEVFEKFVCQPIGEYAGSKLEAEQKALKICRENNIKLTILRLGTVIGENDRGNTARLITLIDKNRFFWIGKGENKKSLIYKADVARIVAKIVEDKEFKGGIFNLTAEAVSMSEIVGAIYKNLKKKPPRMFMPDGLMKKLFVINKFGNINIFQKAERTLTKWLSDEIYSGQKLLREYNLEPQTGIAEAIERQVAFYQQSKHSRAAKK